MNAGAAAPGERTLVFLLAAVTFVNILDFMMVMPLGPDFAKNLGIPLSQLGLIGGSYTAAAAVAGLVGSTFLDRFGRRSALTVAMLGLAGATALGAAAEGMGSLVVARIAAGCFGGPAAALVFAIVADVIPPERRGRAMGAVMGSFAFASVIGVPIGLELSRISGWRTPFLTVGAVGLVMAVLALFILPPLRGHLERGPQAPLRSIGLFLADKSVLLAAGATLVTFLGTFLWVPHIATYVQFNLGYPREKLGLLYMAGGVVALFSMRLGGAWVDKGGPLRVTLLGSAVTIATLATAFLTTVPPVPIFVLFMGLMMGNSLRSVALNTLASRVPPAPERARFMSIQSAVQHMAAAVGAVLSSVFLSEGDQHRLVGMDVVTWVSIGMALALPFLIANLAARVTGAGRPQG